MNNITTMMNIIEVKKNGNITYEDVGRKFE